MRISAFEVPGPEAVMYRYVDFPDDTPTDLKQEWSFVRLCKLANEQRKFFCPILYMLILPKYLSRLHN